MSFRRSETKVALASKLIGCIQSKRSMPFTAAVDDRQYQVIASHADDSTGSVRIRIRLSGKKSNILYLALWLYNICRITNLLHVYGYNLFMMFFFQFFKIAFKL